MRKNSVPSGCVYWATANLANLAQFGGKWAGLAVLFSWKLKTAPRIFIFSIVLGAENLSFVKSIETHARAFLPLNSSAISSVIHTKAARWRAFKLGNAL